MSVDKIECINAYDLFYGTHIVNTKNPCKDLLVADATVLSFGAVGDGISDDTEAFKKALEYVSSIGGGTVFVPEGKYRITDKIKIAPLCALRGDSKIFEDEKICGTVLLCEYGKGNDDFLSEAFIEMETDSKISNISIYYPEQMKQGKIIPYAWTIHMFIGATVEDVALINSYRGVRIGPDVNLLTTIRNLYGTPLKLGIYIDHNVDIGRFENITFTPDFWVNSGFEAPDIYLIKNQLINNAVGIRYERVDWTYFWDFTIEGYNIGMLSHASSTGSSEPGCAGGQIYNAKISNCNTCIKIDDITWAGAHLTKSYLSTADSENAIAINLGERFDTSYSLYQCEIKSKGYGIITNGTGNISLVASMLECKKDAVRLNNEGTLSAIESDVKGRVLLSEKIRNAEFVNVSNLNLEDNSTSEKTRIITSDEQLDTPDIPDFDYNKIYNHKPNGKSLFVLNDVDKNKDISLELQVLLNEAYKVGGGIVFVPSGEYRLDNSVTVPSGVELRGCGDGMIHYCKNGTTFLTRFGEGREYGQPLIVMKEKSGLRNFKVFHDAQDVNNLKKYPFVVEGRGEDCYVVNVMLVNPWQGINFASYPCDRHFLMGVYGIALKTAIKIGCASKDGIMRDCHFNPNSWCGTEYCRTNKEYKYGEFLDLLWPKLLCESDCFVIENVKNEMTFLNFVYGAWRGFLLSSGADIVSMGNAADGAGMALEVEDCAEDKPIWFVANQLCVAGGHHNECYFKTTDMFSGKANVIQTVAFGSPPLSVRLDGGIVNMIQFRTAFIWKDTRTQVILNNKESWLLGCGFVYDKPISDIQITENIGSAHLYGNIFDCVKHPNIEDNSQGKAVGSDLELYTV